MTTVEVISNSTKPAEANSNRKLSVLKRKNHIHKKPPRSGTRFSFFPLEDEQYNLDKEPNDQETESND